MWTSPHSHVSLGYQAQKVTCPSRPTLTYKPADCDLRRARDRELSRASSVGRPLGPLRSGAGPQISMSSALLRRLQLIMRDGPCPSAAATYTDGLK